MKFKNLKQVERIIMILSILTILLFVTSYFIHMVFFYGFLVSLALMIFIWVGYWKCPHCGKNLWYNFDAPCKHCGKNVFEEPEKKPKNTGERTGFFNW